jgi:hypothetical protein
LTICVSADLDIPACHSLALSIGQHALTRRATITSHQTAIQRVNASIGARNGATFDEAIIGSGPLISAAGGGAVTLSG